MTDPLSTVYPSWAFGLVFLAGAFTVARFLLKTYLVFSQTFLLSGKSLKHFGANEGAWAVVTGASDGIGKEFSLQLAASGFNVLLVARDRIALTAVAAEIEQRTAGKVETRIHLIDFAKNNSAAWNELESTIRGLNIGVLVNNVGKSYAMPTYFVETTEQENEDIVMVNVQGTVHVTHAVLPGMIQRKCGLILNIGSFAGQVATPMLATYAGTKAFISTFTSALAEEVRAHNIIVQHLNTHYVVSKMSNIQSPSTFVPTPKAYVRSALSKVGLSCGAALSNRPDTVTPFWSHALVDYVIFTIEWKSFFILCIHMVLKDTRRWISKKLEREAKGQ